MSRNTLQTIVMLVAFFMFIVVHALFRFVLNTMTDLSLRQVLGYTQFALYGTLFLVGLSGLMVHKFNQLIRSSRPQQKQSLIKIQKRIQRMHYVSYSYYGVLVLLWLFDVEVDAQRLYHYLLYLITALISAFIISKYQNQNPFVMDRS